MLPQRVPKMQVAAAPTTRKSVFSRKKLTRYALYTLLATSAVCALRFLYAKCDTRAHMSVLLTKTTSILKANDVEYWLDKGTLLGVHRDDGLIPWEYDVDLGVMNATCDQISALKPEFEKVGLVAYDRSDYIPHKVKLTYDTENHHFYWSDPYMHDPCIRVYDSSDVATWVDIYWYVKVDAAQVAANRKNVLVPPGYDDKSSLLCCSEGLQEYTDHMCCGGCVPYDSVFPLKKQLVTVPDGVKSVQEQFVPNAIPEFLSIQYGEHSLKKREIKGWKGVVCGFWTSPLLFMVHLAMLNGVLVFIAIWYRRRRAAKQLKRRNL
uniref:LicD/FKTN/FKRP nucleotidyltransferase domain-containing protein n=1 Tax=Globisporangium ultimum (strain ATCC 200006 / CBS 805.95 / DAOM BR144) TaxID=431595 RepID=K3WL32_GLOUD